MAEDVRYWQISSDLMNRLFGDEGDVGKVRHLVEEAAVRALGQGMAWPEFLERAEDAFERAERMRDVESVG